MTKRNGGGAEGNLGGSGHGSYGRSGQGVVEIIKNRLWAGVEREDVGMNGGGSRGIVKRERE